MITREQVLWNVHTALGMPRQEWGLTNADIFHAIEMGAMPLFSKYYPYFTQVKITPQDKTPQPGLYKIPIKDYTESPNFVKIDPVNIYRYIEGILDVKLKHDMSFRTIDDGLHDIFIELCVLYVKYMLYNRYRDLKDGVLNGVNISTDIDEWSGAEDGIKEWSDGRKTQYYKHRKRIRAQYMFF